MGVAVCPRAASGPQKRPTGDRQAVLVAGFRVWPRLRRKRGLAKRLFGDGGGPAEARVLSGDAGGLPPRPRPKMGAIPTPRWRTAGALCAGLHSEPTARSAECAGTTGGFAGWVTDGLLQCPTRFRLALDGAISWSCHCAVAYKMAVLDEGRHDTGAAQVWCIPLWVVIHRPNDRG